MAANPDDRYTDEEYLALDRASSTKYELINLALVAMTGASRRHNLIMVSAAAALVSRMRGKSCKVFPSDMRLRLQRGTYVYPDITVVCGETQVINDQHRDTLLNPTLVVEILSASTADYDRGGKLALYRALPSVQAVLLVEQDRAHVELVERVADTGVWTIRDYDGLETVVSLDALDIELPLADIYEQIADELMDSDSRSY